MKKAFHILVILLSSAYLAACSLDKNAAALYKEEVPLAIDIILPKDLEPNKAATIQAVLTQDGKKVEHADYVHFEIWKKDGSIHYEMESAKAEGNGIYSLKKTLNESGLYVIKVHGSNEGSIVMPSKQFAVGELSEEELNSLKEETTNDEGNTEHQH